MVKETYYMAKETYYMAKETSYMAKETYDCTTPALHKNKNNKQHQRKRNAVWEGGGLHIKKSLTLRNGPNARDPFVVGFQLPLILNLPPHFRKVRVHALLFRQPHIQSSRL